MKGAVLLKVKEASARKFLVNPGRQQWITDSPQVNGETMNKDQADGNWKQLKGKVKEKWGKLTDDDSITIEGNANSWSAKFRSATVIRKRRPKKR